MNRDTPILVAAVQALMLVSLDYFNVLAYGTAMIVLLIGTLYLVWSNKE